MKKLTAILLALVMLLSLCACGSSPAPAAQEKQESAPAGAAAAEPVTIRVSGLNQQLSLPLYYIHEQGWDVENGFNLALFQVADYGVGKFGIVCFANVHRSFLHRFCIKKMIHE